MRILAIDPGPSESALLVYDTETGRPEWFQMCPNESDEHTTASEWIGHTHADLMAVEMVASYGMAVGKDVFETVYWIGRFCERWVSRIFFSGPPPQATRIYRREVKMHLCADSRAKDANIRQALIDRYGPGKERAIGRKASPGPLYGLTGDCWSALAVAITCAETRLEEAAA